MLYKEKYESWISSDFLDNESKKELMNIKDEKEVEDRFYKDLEFGTGGLRGVIGIGTNRMNIYTIGKATQGLAEYLLHKYEEKPSVAIAYDSRIMSREFADAAACTLCANNIKVYLFEDLRPTPMLSYTVRHLKCKAGIVITASHNPKQYNGYKVYGEDGGQVTDIAAKEILSHIQDIDFSEIKIMNKSEAMEKSLLNIIGEEVDKTYIERVKDLTIRKELVDNYAKDLNIIYTPIHGAGNMPIRRVLKELGYTNLNIVKEQEKPDGTFPTAAYPNPEESKVFNIALNMAKDIQPDIIFGTDPDCDRIGVVVKDSTGEYKVLSGNQTGVLLTHYIISSLKELNKLPENGVVIKTIVTTEMAAAVARDYNIEVIDVLTGFKYIGEKIKEFEKAGDKKYLFGFEESYGYLAGDFVRDKDAVIAAMLICEMTLYYKNKGMSLYEALMNLYERYGFYKESLFSLELAGKEGQEKIQQSLEYLRHSMSCSVGSNKIVRKADYKLSVEKDLVNIKENKINLPKSNVLKFVLEDDSYFVVRPSGTEPKMKIYLSVTGDSLQNSDERMKLLLQEVKDIIDRACNC